MTRPEDEGEAADDGLLKSVRGRPLLFPPALRKRLERAAQRMEKSRTPEE